MGGISSEDEKTLASLALALGVVLALVFPGATSFFEPYLLHSLFFVMVFSLLPFARHETEALTQIHPVVMAVVLWQQFILPSLVIIIGFFLQLDKQLLYFILLTVTSGSLFASPTLVQLMGLEQRMAVQTVVISTLATPISIYLSFSAVNGGTIDLDMGHFAFRLFVFLVVPMSIFALIRMHIRKWNEKKKDQLDRCGRWGSVIALIIFCFALETQASHLIAENPRQILDYLVLAVTVAVSIAILTRMVMTRFGAKMASTAAVLASFRNVGLTFGLVGSIAGPELAVYVGVCQIPMFFAPLLFDLFIGKSRVPYRNDHQPNDSQSDDPNPSSVPEQFDYPPFPENTQRTSFTMNTLNQSPSIQGNTQMSTYVTQGATALAVQEYPEPVVENNIEPQIDEALEPQLDTASDLQLSEDARALQNRLLEEHRAGGRNDADALDPYNPKFSAQYAVAFLLLCVLGVTAIWQANKHYYPMLFDQGLIEQVADVHTKGENFGVYDLNINIRDLRDATIARMEKTPEVVVLGASHWQEAHVNLLPGRDFYNSHVHRDYYEDMMAVTEMWVRHGKLPKEMIITIRDNLLTPISERTDFLWLPGIKYYQDFAKRIGFTPHASWETAPYQTWRELVSLPLLWGQASHDFATSDVPRPVGKGTEFEELDVLLPGGSILWSGEHQRLFTQERARKESLDFAAYKRKNPPQIDPKGIEHMEALFEFLVRNDVKVTLAHPQFNPIFWDAVQGSPYIDGLEKIENLTKTWANKYGFKTMGGFAPEDVGCVASQYIDAEHGNPTCLGMLLAQYPYQTNLNIDFTLRGTVNGFRSTVSQ